MTGILMFPAMLLGPSLAGILLTKIVEGRSGLWNLFCRISPVGFHPLWYASLLIPPALVLAVLFCLEKLVSPVFAPNHFLIGILFGVPAGLLEEIGWTGFAFPQMSSRSDPLLAGISLGLLWSIWHAPVINYLGTAVPHGSHWLPFFLAFAMAMTAMRVLICWIYTNTKSVWMAQLMHVSSTGSLVVFSAPSVSAAQEVMWYGIYGTALWLIVALITAVCGKSLTRQAA